ncbi:MAG: hypothetical protein JWN80_2047 [Microbacteriaceae bacterium]|jgi:alanine racemase|nr:hypothetical protein [Microbacteriaceae bacterium]
MLHSVRIDAAAICANAGLLAAAGDRIADVSFDGWGHGALVSAGAALEGGATGLAVASDAEERQLRSSGITAPISRTGNGPDELYGWVAGFTPAMRVTAEVVGLKPVQPGDGVSYGYTFRARSRSMLGMVGIGYADGLDRAAGNAGALVVGGREMPIVGRVAMNVLMVDLGSEVVPIGTTAEVFGESRTVSVWATAIGRRPEEIVLEFAAKASRGTSPGANTVAST